MWKTTSWNPCRLAPSRPAPSTDLALNWPRLGQAALAVSAHVDSLGHLGCWKKKKVIRFDGCAESNLRSHDGIYKTALEQPKDASSEGNQGFKSKVGEKQRRHSLLSPDFVWSCLGTFGQKYAPHLVSTSSSSLKPFGPSKVFYQHV